MKITKVVTSTVTLEDPDSGLDVILELKDNVPVYAKCVKSGEVSPLVWLDLTNLQIVKLIAGIIQIKRYLDEERKD